MTTAHQYIRKLKDLRDGIREVKEMLDGAVTVNDRAIAIAILEELYVEADLAIDKPCNCGDGHKH
jgi:hypothetical protein